METEEKAKLDLGSLGSFDFTPDWAKKDAGVSVGKIRPAREFDDRPPRGDKKPFGDRKPSGERKPMGGERKPFGPRKPFGERKFGAAPRAERPQPLDVEVKVLPSTQALGTIIRRLQGDAHAYKLKDLAYFFLDNPQSVLLKVTPKGETPVTFHQCRACGFVSTKQEDVIEHALLAHLGDYYESKETECEPPKGNFNCVAKCGLSGVLLGPPNIHEFGAVVKEMIRTRYPDMSEAEYRSRIEMVRDSEAIEAWRKGATKKTVYFAKADAGKLEGEIRCMTREQAEGEFKRLVLPSLLDVPRHLMVTADVAEKSPVKPLVWAVRDALEAERRAPYNMCFALRGAFHHRKLHFFRVNDSRGQEFVTSVELKEFDAAHAIPELARVAQFVAEHPCSPKVDIATSPEVEQHLNWLVSTGHVVAFSNGVFSAVEKFPKYGPQWQRRAAKKPAAPAAGAAEPVAAEKPAEPGPVAVAEPVAAAEPVASPSVAGQVPEVAVAELASVAGEKNVEESKE